MTQNFFGIDIGTSNFKMYYSGNRQILNEKNVIAIANKKKFFSCGNDAFDMVGKAPDNIDVTFPVKYGVIADNNNMETLIEKFYYKATGLKKPIPGDFYITVPTEVTEVEKRAFYELVAGAKIKAKHIYVIEKPIADGIGTGIDVTNAKGVMIINMGADTTEVSVLSLGGIVLSKGVKLAGNKFDESIINMVRKYYNLVIGNKTAEYIKFTLASATKIPEKKINVFGRDVVTGLPIQVPISSNLVYECLIDQFNSLVDSVKAILERTPPELSADIIDSGIYITGGSSNISGICDLIKKETSLKVLTIEKPEESVIRGIIEVINNPKKYEGIAKIPREKVYY